MNRVVLSPGYYPQETSSRALFNAKIYVGEPDTDPTVVANQKTLTVLEEDGSLTVVAQPIRTNAGGVPVYDDNPVTLLVEGNYSLKVLTCLDAQVYYIPNMGYDQPLGLDKLSNYEDWADAIATIGATPTTLVVDQSETEIPTATVPATLELMFIDSNTIQPANGATFTINGPISAPNTTIFDYSLGGEIVLGGYNPWNVTWWGGDANAAREIATVLNDNTPENARMYFPSGEYTIEATITDPYNAAVNNIALLFTGLTGLTIDVSEATIKQSTTDANGGVFTFNNCIDCKVIGGRYDGVYILGGQISNAWVTAIGACDGIEVLDPIVNGGQSIFWPRSSDGTATGTKPKNTKVRGISNGAQYGVDYTHCGYGHTFDIVGEDLVRGVFVTGTSGIIGKLSGEDINNPINISSRGSGDIENVTIEVACIGAHTAIGIGVSDATACTIKNIRISGQITVDQATGVAGLCNDFGDASTVIEAIDLSDLWITVESTANGGFTLTPDLACTITDFHFPNIRSAASGQDLIIVDNTIAATIKRLKTSKIVEYNGAAAGVLCINSDEGTIDDWDISGTRFPTTTSGSFSVRIHNCVNIYADGAISNKPFNFNYSDTNTSFDKSNRLITNSGFYDHATHGDIAAGTNFVLGYIPDNARIIKAWYEVQITFTSATDAAQIGIGIDTDDDSGIFAQVAISAAADWDASAPHVCVDCIQDGAAANMSVKTTAERAINLENAAGPAEAVTEGRIRVWWSYTISE